MSEERARAEAKRLQGIMVRHGVRCSIELQPGRPWSGSSWWSTKRGVMNHHTAGAATGNTPSLYLVKHGRSDLPGPLCNGYGGRDGIYRIITMGLANHPGQGGPLTLPGGVVPKDSARISMWGTEWEHTGVDPWLGDMAEFMGRSNSALLEWMGEPIEASVEHSTWTPRKIDRYRYTAGAGQQEIRLWRARVKREQESSVAELTESQVRTVVRGEIMAALDDIAKAVATDPAADVVRVVDDAGQPIDPANPTWMPSSALSHLLTLGRRAEAARVATDARLTSLSTAVQALVDGLSAADIREAFTEGVQRIEAAGEELQRELGEFQVRMTVEDTGTDEETPAAPAAAEHR